MKRTELLQEIRLMRFEEAYGGWTRGCLTQSEAASLLGVCDRTFRRYLVRYEVEGLDGLIDRRLAQAVRSHWAVENQLHGCMDVAFADDQMRARTGHAAHNLAILKHITLNLIRLDPIKRKGGIKARRLIAATSDLYRAQLLGLA